MAKIKIKLLTVTKCSPTGREPYTRFDYIPLDMSSKSDKVKGKIVSAFFVNGHEAFEKVPESLIDQELLAEVDYEPNPREPLKPRPKITSLESKNGIVDLV